MWRNCLSSDQETLNLDRLGFAKNIEWTLPLSRFRNREKSFLAVIERTE